MNARLDSDIRVDNPIFQHYMRFSNALILGGTLLLPSTPPNFRVCARRKVPAKHFKICHILYIRTYTKTQSCFFRFSFRATLLFFLMNALVYGKKQKVAQNEKRKKQLWVFVYVHI